MLSNQVPPLCRILTAASKSAFLGFFPEVCEGDSPCNHKVGKFIIETHDISEKTIVAKGKPPFNLVIGKASVTYIGLEVACELCDCFSIQRRLS